MQPDPAPPAPTPADPGLPPVQPPSGGMILRLFLVPFLIVAVLVGVYLAGRMVHGLLTGAHAPERYLKRLDSDNPEIRWRAASDLSQELPRSPRLEIDATFAVELAGRLRAALDDSAAAEQAFAERYDRLSPAERDSQVNRDLLPRRKLVTFLAACLSNFAVPVGAPLLAEMATTVGGMEPGAQSERRGLALFNLAVLGQKLTRFDALSDDDRERIVTTLTAGEGPEGTATLARSTADYLQRRREKKADGFGVPKALLRCAADPDPYIRELTAYASNFWTGTAVEEKAIEDALVKLANDDGTGEDRLHERERTNPAAGEARSVCKRKGYRVQVNANLALCRRGSPQVRLDLLDEMLSPERLGKVFVLQQPGGEERPEAALISGLVAGTLKAMGELHRRRPELPLDRYRPAISKLIESNDPAIRTGAERLLGELSAK